MLKYIVICELWNIHKIYNSLDSLLLNGDGPNLIATGVF